METVYGTYLINSIKNSTFIPKTAAEFIVYQIHQELKPPLSTEELLDGIHQSVVIIMNSSISGE